MEITGKMNLNDTVLVELNERGWDYIFEHYKKLFDGVCIESVDKMAMEYVVMHKNHTQEYIVDGEPRQLNYFQLHELMNIFGDKCYCGAENFIVGNTVYLIHKPE